MYIGNCPNSSLLNLNIITNLYCKGLAMFICKMNHKGVARSKKTVRDETINNISLVKFRTKRHLIQINLFLNDNS